MGPEVQKKPDHKNRKHRVYTPEFKKEVVALAKELGTSEASKKLGVPLSNIAKWRSGHAMKSAITPEQRDLHDEIKRLKRQLEQSEAVIEVLKKTAAIFSREHLT